MAGVWNPANVQTYSTLNKTIYIIRHGETELNKTGIVQGSGVDSELNETGWNQSTKFFKKYEQLPFEVVLSSKLQRTHQTVKSFINKGLPWHQFAEINEINWGIHEGKSARKWMHQEYKEVVAEWQNGNFDARITEGESARELGHRLMEFINHLKKREEQLILVCAHGRAIRCLICLMKGLPLTQMQTIGHHNTGLYLAQQIDNRFIFELENDISHL